MHWHLKWKIRRGNLVSITAAAKKIMMATNCPATTQLLADMLAAAHQLPVKAYEEKTVASSLIG